MNPAFQNAIPNRVQIVRNPKPFFDLSGNLDSFTLAEPPQRSATALSVPTRTRLRTGFEGI
jgi:hypothetical protein